MSDRFLLMRTLALPVAAVFAALLPIIFLALLAVGAREPMKMKTSGSVFCVIEDPWGDSEWRPCSDAMAWGI